MTTMFGVRAFTEEESEALIGRIVELHGLPRSAVARRLGVSQSTIGRYTAIARERGLLPPPDRVHPPETVEALLRDLAQPGWSVSELARKYGYTKAGVYYHAIKHGYYMPAGQ